MIDWIWINELCNQNGICVYVSGKCTQYGHLILMDAGHCPSASRSASNISKSIIEFHRPLTSSTWHAWSVLALPRMHDIWYWYVQSTENTKHLVTAYKNCLFNWWTFIAIPWWDGVRLWMILVESDLYDIQWADVEFRTEKENHS